MREIDKKMEKKVQLFYKYFNDFLGGMKYEK
jgi:hypothetical protein